VVLIPGIAETAAELRVSGMLQLDVFSNSSVVFTITARAAVIT
jgi:hypothetical protein